MNRDSGEVMRLKVLFRPSDSTGAPGENLLSVYRDYGVIPKSSRNDNFNRTPENLDRYLLVRPGDLVVNRMKAWQGSLGVSGHRGIVSPDYEVLRPVGGRMHQRFAHYLLRSPMLVAEYGPRSTGIRPSQWRLYWEQMGDIRVCVPSLDEQRQIAGYLDRETARIDALIGKQEQLIDTLRERRGATVRNSVTTGLRPPRAVASTGYTSLPSIPSHWDAVRARFLCRIDTGASDTVNAVEGGAYPLFVRSQTPQRSSRYLFECEAVMTAGDGAGVGKVFHYFSGRFDAHQRVYVLHDFRRVTGRFFFYFFSAFFALAALDGSAKSTVDSVRRWMVADLPVAVPPLDEQRQIVEYLDEQTARIDRLIGKTQRVIEVSKERRSALITAAVTGQVDVRSKLAADGVLAGEGVA